MLRWTLGCTCLFQIWFPRCVCPGVGLLGHMAVLFPAWFSFNKPFWLDWASLGWPPLWFPGGSDSKESDCKSDSKEPDRPRRLGSIHGSGRSPGEENGYPLQYSCLENSMDREAWWATVHGLTKNWTRVSNKN